MAATTVATRARVPVRVHVHSWVSPGVSANDSLTPLASHGVAAQHVQHPRVVREPIGLAAFVIGLLAIATVLFSGAFHSHLLVGLRTDLSVVKSGVVESERRWRGSFGALQDELTKVDARVRETVTPAGPFDTGRTLFNLGRYAEAEAAFTRYVVTEKDGRFVDAALFYSGLSLMHMRNCVFATERFARLLSKYQDSPYAALATEDLEICKQVQRAAARAK